MSANVKREPFGTLPGGQAVEAITLREHVAAGDWPDPRETMVIADASDDRFIGQVSWYWSEKPTQDPGDGTHLLPLRSLGITVYSPEHWSGGYGTEAMRLYLVVQGADAHHGQHPADLLA